MLRLEKITKDYEIAGGSVHALKGIDLAFRKSEFVSILGPSGCGKTTLLNIIGGLDNYTSGELFIDEISTKNYKDRDWDTYRNHRIGFIFQSYNLIPHQTILQNVELALTISGVDKTERVKRAKEALDKVGLEGQYNKKPNQLSGGQCQRVAIARALVNNPEILLADEPTGALDTTTSVQIMELIKEISNDKLVIMVTHNPELAEKYSTRIIKLLDGNIVSDSNPFTAEVKQEVVTQSEDLKEEVSENNAKNNKKDKKSSKNKPKSVKKSKLSLLTAFKLSAKNLLSKLKRTLLVCLAGSIGIIGVATVLAVSSGVQNYIHSMQDDMLSGNPILISEETYNLSAMMNATSNAEKRNALNLSIENGKINVDNVIDRLIQQSKDLSSFKVSNDITEQYIKFVEAMPKEYYSSITELYNVNLSNNLYTNFGFDGITENVSLTAANKTYMSLLDEAFKGDEKFSNFSSYISMVLNSFEQAPSSNDFILSQYDIISDPKTSKIATEANEIMIVLNDKTSLSDLMLAQYGYFNQEEFFNIINKATNNENYNSAIWKERFTYEEIMSKTFTYYKNDTIFTKNESASAVANPFYYSPYVNEDFEDGMPLKITAILRPKENISYGCMESGFYYTEALAKQMIADNKNSEIVNYLKDNNKTSFTNIPDNKTNLPCVVTYNYDFTFNGTKNNVIAILGTENSFASMMSSMMGSSATNSAIYTLTLRDLGGMELPNSIKIYPVNFDLKDNVTSYLDKWNSDDDIIVNGVTIKASERSNITYTDNLAIIIDMINNFINIVTYALVAFTALSLVVSIVMIAIITYVSVIERVKEIGVIRSLGGRKRDVSALFFAETFLIGGISGVLGIGITYLLSLILNLTLGSLVGISTIAALPITTAIILILVSILLTMVAGLIPARLAAKKDPVDALRSE